MSLAAVAANPDGLLAGLAMGMTVLVAMLVYGAVLTIFRRAGGA